MEKLRLTIKALASEHNSVMLIKASELTGVITRKPWTPLTMGTIIGSSYQITTATRRIGTSDVWHVVLGLGDQPGEEDSCHRYHVRFEASGLSDMHRLIRFWRKVKSGMFNAEYRPGPWKLDLIERSAVVASESNGFSQAGIPAGIARLSLLIERTPA